MIYKRCLTYWRIGLFSPLVYMLISLLIDLWVFQNQIKPGYYRFEDSTFESIWKSCFGIGCAFIVIAFLLKKYWWENEKALERFKDPDLIVEKMKWRYLLILTVCDIIALTGLILFILQGPIEITEQGGSIFLTKLKIPFIFSITGMLAYLAVYPIQPSIDKIISPQ